MFKLTGSEPSTWNQVTGLLPL